MPVDVTPILVPMFAVLTALVVVPAAVFTTVAARRHAGRRGCGTDRVRVEIRAARPRAHSA